MPLGLPCFCLQIFVLGLLCNTIVSKTGTSHSSFVLGLLCNTIVSKTGTSHSSFVLGLLCNTVVSKTGTSHSPFVLGLPGYVLDTECVCQVTSWIRNVSARLRPGYEMCLPGYVLDTKCVCQVTSWIRNLLRCFSSVLDKVKDVSASHLS